MFALNLPWKQIGYGLLIALVVGVLYYYFVYVPDKYEQEKAKNKELIEQAEQNKKTLNLNNDIQKGKEQINERVQSQISTNHSKPVPRKSIVIRGGMPLRSVH